MKVSTLQSAVLNDTPPVRVVTVSAIQKKKILCKGIDMSKQTLYNTQPPKQKSEAIMFYRRRRLTDDMLELQPLSTVNQ